VAPKSVRVLVPGAYGRRDSAGVIKLEILRWGDYSGSSGWSQHNHKGLSL
jgi:hypothetical protein